jgi:hypothetical protein
VSVDLSTVGSTFGSVPVDATLCVNGDCQTTKVVLTNSQISRVVSHAMPSESPAEPTVSVTVKLERDGKLLVESTADATLTKLTPNGERCGPICYSSMLRLDGGQLTSVPLETGAS